MVVDINGVTTQGYERRREVRDCTDLTVYVVERISSPDWPCLRSSLLFMFLSLFGSRVLSLRFVLVSRVLCRRLSQY